MLQQKGNRDNDYSFDDYLFVRDQFNYYRDDDFFQALVKKHAGADYQKIHEELNELSNKASYYYRDLAAEGGTIENRVKLTKLKHYDAYNHRIDRLERSAATEALEKEVLGLGLFDHRKNTPWSRFVKCFLLYQNSEAGVMCGFGGTHGLIALMEKYETSGTLSPEATDALAHCREGRMHNGEYEYASAGQYMSEIQGGSDVGANLVEAEFVEKEGKDGKAGVWRIYGKKFFCSATQSQYTFVTAKPKNTDSETQVATFLVPAWLPENRDKEIRNGYTIDRLKSKLGLSELPTAEITFNGAVAYPVGPLKDGMANIVGVVLALSRLHVAFGTAAGMLRMYREASLYAQFRKAFTLPIAEFPMMANQLEDLKLTAKRTSAGCFKLYDEARDLNEKLAAGLKELEAIEDMEHRRRLFRLREMILLQKIVVCHDGPAFTRQAISTFGGHGIMEDFSAFPRMMRDGLIQELWEGPRNVLLTQIHRDFGRVKAWYPADQFVKDILIGASDSIIEPLATRFQAVIDHPHLMMNDQQTREICREWELLSADLVHAYQDQALAELNYQGKADTFAELKEKFSQRQQEQHRERQSYNAVSQAERMV
ncbi:hypothetical protein R50073_30750 [Maricurvus nonylphenolicus]|uniref:acyl-CoA dehydrogenase family protein n=1 Tax=Maricurvus nonylphenolicus TaxID=1008307 RepID=UPI0036F2F94D